MLASDLYRVAICAFIKTDIRRQMQQINYCLNPEL